MRQIVLDYVKKKYILNQLQDNIQNVNVDVNFKKYDNVTKASGVTLKKAQKEGADYIGTGAIFPTATKDDAPSVTKDELRDIVESIDIPVVAIGGIKLSNVDEIKDCGIKGISVVSEIMDSNDPKKTSEELLEIFNK